MNHGDLSSWGRVLWPKHELHTIEGTAEPLPARPSMLAFGNGRSYGDSNLNPDGTLLLTRGIDRILGFDAATGVLDAEAGLLLSQVLDLCVPQGWFPAVTPGTQFVTLGGAIANDVHGKNHHRAGSFGHHVLGFELLRSDGSRRWCSPSENADWFAATIGGLGLTGLVTRVRLQLRRIANAGIESETIRFRSLEEFFALSEESAAGFEYTAAWVDCASGGARLGRGLFERGNHASPGVDPVLLRPPSAHTRRMPFTPPVSLVNGLTLKLFNAAYFHRQRGDRVAGVRHYRPWLYPLDALLEWNRLYGPRGFYQYQCVVPPAAASRHVRALLGAVAASGMGSFLAVLKQFGDRPSPGLLSFPCAGATLALDFPNRGARLEQLFERLDRIVLEAGGRLYPAKDGRMGATIFRAGYPRWQKFGAFVDPSFSSAFWRRVSEG
ncbi:FAD-binding oxidoreductase [Rivibacter subsaxonicus]|uniref:FAD/FMN-containing dehydrogenase n=1 Tax=Rivibacter subsaxonicus TaxID=457575 RepID=A0A4Q7W255_9BURK|nr:FAD-binding oxidoreductase [Rivibacter subsaxonicus]RZU02659.1 FAD/FMN-containing dehydrogenase [Rivibacter subsaxonicus]